MARAWTVRGGRHGEREQAALDGDVVIAGWESLGDLTECSTIADLGALLHATYPGEAARTVENWKHQLWRFRITMAAGDLVVMPRKYRNSIAIGQLSGDYEYRADAPAGFRHVRSVKWLCKEVDRAVVGGDLRDSMGAFLTISELSRRNAVSRVEELAATGRDPGYEGRVDPPADFAALQQEVGEVGTRQLTARDLIGLAGWQRRTADVIDLVDQRLAALGLAVDPHFTEVRLDGLVTVSALRSDEAEGPADDWTAQPAGGPDDRNVGEDLALRIAHLPLTREVSVIESSAPLARAITWLVEGRCSQIPVVDRHRRLVGVVSWESIARSRLANRPESLTDAMDRHPRTAREQEELFSRIDDIQRHGYLIIVDSENVVVGILSAADLAQQLKQRIRPFIVLEELERRLRRAVGILSVEDLRAAFGNKGKASKIQEPKDLTLGNYPFLLDDDGRWAKLAWPYERDDIVQRLRAVASYRNDLAHWAVDVPEEDVARLAATEQLLSLLKAVDRDPSS